MISLTFVVATGVTVIISVFSLPAGFGPDLSPLLYHRMQAALPRGGADFRFNHWMFAEYGKVRDD